MSEPGVKVCPRCAGEFQSWVSECPDCEIPLLSPAELATKHAAATAASQEVQVATRDLERRLATVPKLEPTEGLLFKAGSSHDCLLAAESLTARDIPWRMAPLYGVYVLPKDFEDAERALAEDALEGVPDAQPVAPSEDTCPACGARVHPGDGQCADCGLAFG